MYLTNFTDDELERTLVQMPGDFAVIREAARRFVPGGREALVTVRELREQLDECERAHDRGGEIEDLQAEIARLTEANEMLNGVVEALTEAAGGRPEPTPDQIDRHLDAVLKASGSALRYHTVPLGLDRMRAAMRSAMGGAAG